MLIFCGDFDYKGLVKYRKVQYVDVEMRVLKYLLLSPFLYGILKASEGILNRYKDPESSCLGKVPYQTYHTNTKTRKRELNRQAIMDLRQQCVVEALKFKNRCTIYCKLGIPLEIQRHIFEFDETLGVDTRVAIIVNLAARIVSVDTEKLCFILGTIEPPSDPGSLFCAFHGFEQHVLKIKKVSLNTTENYPNRSVRIYETSLAEIWLMCEGDKLFWNPRLFWKGHNIFIKDKASSRQPTLSDLCNKNPEFIETAFISEVQNLGCIMPDCMHQGKGYTNASGDRTMLSNQAIACLYYILEQTAREYFGNPDNNLMTYTVEALDPFFNTLKRRVKLPENTRVQFNCVTH